MGRWPRLEGGTQALVFSSGLAVATALVQGLEPGDHIVAPDDVYWGLRKVIGDVFGKWNLAVDYVDMSRLDAVRAALRPETRLLWVETPSNPLMKIADLAAKRRLRSVQFFLGRDCQTSRLRDRDEIAEVP